MTCPTPTKGYLFVEPVYDTVSDGGIVLCKQAQERHLPTVGIVQAIAPGSEVDFKVGDKVVHERFEQEWQIIPWGEKKLTRIKIENVQAVL